MPDILQTDIAVIGAGTAGLAAFHTIRRAGREALLIDRGPLGTTCARVGCMPSKAVLHASHRWSVLRELAGPPPAGGASAQGLWREAIAMRDTRAAGAAGRTRAAAGERLLEGQARFVGPGELEVDGRRVRARAFVVATGSHPVVPAGLEALGECLLTTDTLFERERLPRSIGILGLGAVGLEMAVALSRLGVRVVAGDLKAMPAGLADPALADRVSGHFRQEMTLWLGHPVEVRPEAGGAEISSGGQSELVEVVLAALGRRPNLQQLHLAAAGVAFLDDGRARVDATSLRAPGTAIFLAGDVHPDRPLMHEAADEGVIAALGALSVLDGEAARLPRRHTPLAIVFSDPDVCTVGARYDQLDPASIVIGASEGSTNGRSRILGAQDSLVRIYARRDDGLILGAGLVAKHGEHLAHLLAWAIQRGETVRTLLDMPYYHPSVEELLQSALKHAAGQLEQLS